MGPTDSINYSTNMTGGDYGASNAAVMGLGAFLVIFFVELLFIVVVYVVMAILLGKIFKKANVPAWVAWVPIYNVWKLLELGGQPGWWSVLSLVPIVNIASLVFMYIAMFHIGKKLGKDDMFILWAIFIPIVWYIWLAVDQSTWDDSKGPRRLDTPAVNPAA